jgi:hypothetical protein
MNRSVLKIVDVAYLTIWILFVAIAELATAWRDT